MTDEELIKALTIQLNKMEVLVDKLMKNLKKLESNNEKIKKVLVRKIKRAEQYLKSQIEKGQGNIKIHYYYAERDKNTCQQLLEFIKELENFNG